MPQPSPRPYVVAIGTYTERMPHVLGKGAGIHLRHFDVTKGRFGAEFVAGGLRNPTYLAASESGDRLYAVCEIDAAQGPTLETFAVDQTAPALRHLASTRIPGGCPCHVSLNPAARHLYIANYETGNLVVITLDAEGCPIAGHRLIQRQGSGPRADRQEAAHAHCVLPSPDGRHIYLADLGTDEIARHAMVNGAVSETPDLVIKAAPGAGPRHIAFSPSGRSLLAIHELSSCITLHGLDAPEKIVARLSTLPAGFAGNNTCAAIRIHPSGRFVYASNRGHDSVFLAVLDEDEQKLQPGGHWPAGGRTPRDVAVSPDGRFLLAASQDDDIIAVFEIDPSTGALSARDRALALASPVCLCFMPPYNGTA